MLRINIIAASKIKTSSSIGMLISEYCKRFNKIKLTITEFDEKNMSKQEINSKLLSLIKPNSFTILCDEKGQELSTANFTKKIFSINTNITFLIAGADGFTEEIQNKVDYIFSLSLLTFSHQLARLFLIEQIYRAQCIFNNHPYHRE